MSAPYVFYSDDLEQRHPDEDRLIDEIIASFERQNRKTFDHYRHAVRGTHAKSHGILKGEIRILDDLPEHLRQGVFAVARNYPVVARLSSAPGEIMADSVAAQRGFALKMIGIEGAAMMPGHEGELTQDFVLNNGKRFTAGNVASFLPQQLLFEKGMERFKQLKKLGSLAARGANAVLEKVGQESAMLDFIGHPPVHLLADEYCSLAPLRYGDHVAKLCLRPASAQLIALKDEKHDLAGNFSALRDAVSEFFAEHAAEYELCVQLCTNLETMPVEDASVEWPEEESPYLPVARVVFAPQDSYSPARRVFGDDVLSFSPAHGLLEHRPLGSIMRARMKVYGHSARFRREMNVRPSVEPRSIHEIPD
jgi:hypothetical protein